MNKGTVNDYNLPETNLVRSAASNSEQASSDAVKHLEHWIHKEHYIAMFDVDYYVKMYSDVVLAEKEPVLHFSQYGWKEGRNPSPVFNTKLYLAWHQDVKRANINPLAHFATSGASEGRVVFEVENKLSNIIAEAVDAVGEINFETLWLQRVQLYATSTTDRQRGDIALRLTDWQVAATSYLRHLRNRLQDGHAWLFLSHSLNQLDLTSEALYAAQTADQFGICSDMTCNSDQLSPTHKKSLVNWLPTWAGMFEDHSAAPQLA